MPTEKEKQEITKQIKDIRTDVTALRNNLNQINDEKEGWFKKKEDISKQIADIINMVKSSKKERNDFTSKVKDSKKERENLNDLIKDKIEEIKKLQKEKAEIAKKYNITKDPTSIKKEIERLEMKIETEAISFDKEREYMKIINDLSKECKESGAILDVTTKINKLSKEIDDLKRTAKKSHHEIQNNAKISQEKHEEMIVHSKEIDDLKVKEEEAFKKFLEYKKQFSEVNSQLKEKLVELNGLNKQSTRNKEDSMLEKKKSDSKKLKSKEEEVEEKVKNRKKLTTEDLLVLQHMDAKGE